MPSLSPARALHRASVQHAHSCGSTIHGMVLCASCMCTAIVVGTGLGFCVHRKMGQKPLIMHCFALFALPTSMWLLPSVHKDYLR